MRYSPVSNPNGQFSTSSMLSTLLYGAVALVLIDGVIELSFITSMVHWLHVYAGGQFQVNNTSGGSFSLHGKPQNFLLNQGHTSNGAAGTAFIVVGLGGFLALFLRSRQLKRNGSLHGFTSFLYNFWLVMTVLSALFTLSALIAVMVITYQHDRQSININTASRLNNRPYPDYVAYPDLEWTPQNWFDAVLRLPLVDSTVRSNINMHYTIMKAWQWNLIPMTVLGFIVAILAFADRMKHGQNKAAGISQLELAQRQKMGSPYS